MKDDKVLQNISLILVSTGMCEICNYKEKESYQVPCFRCIDFSEFSFKEGSFMSLAKEIEDEIKEWLGY